MSHFHVKSILQGQKQLQIQLEGVGSVECLSNVGVADQAPRPVAMY